MTKRVQLVLDIEPEDPNTVIDLRSLNSSSGRAKYDVFWDHCSRFLNESVGTAVDDRHHDNVVHLAQAISIRDLRNQVEQHCPAGTPIPSFGMDPASILAEVTSVKAVLSLHWSAGSEICSAASPVEAES